LRLITALILVVTVKKLLRGVMVATELTVRTMETTKKPRPMEMMKKPHPGPSHLNLHQALTFGGTPSMHKGFLIPAKRERLWLTDSRT
jgi:hypothetical protein